MWTDIFCAVIIVWLKTSQRSRVGVGMNMCAREKLLCLFIYTDPRDQSPRRHWPPQARSCSQANNNKTIRYDRPSLAMTHMWPCFHHNARLTSWHTWHILSYRTPNGEECIFFSRGRPSHRHNTSRVKNRVNRSICFWVMRPDRHTDPNALNSHSSSPGARVFIITLCIVCQGHHRFHVLAKSRWTFGLVQ